MDVIIFCRVVRNFSLWGAVKANPESESVTALLHYFLASQDGNKDGNSTLRADCRQPRWFAVYLSLIAGVGFVSG